MNQFGQLLAHRILKEIRQLVAVLYRNLNFGQAVSLEMLQVTTVRADTPFQ